MNDRKTLSIFIIVFLLFSGIGFCVNSQPITNGIDAFGAEYGNIASSILNGRGYSSPFGTESGPTAWMPPLYPFLLYTIFLISGEQSNSSFNILLTLKYLALSLVIVMLYSICKIDYPGICSLLIVPIFIVFIFLSFGTFFKNNHDNWLIMFFITLLFYKYLHYFHFSTVSSSSIGWGILGGLTFLASPVLGALYIALTLMPIGIISWKNRVLMIFLTTLIFSPWIVRNYLIFDKIILIKSNLFFDLYQSNYLDDDGVIGVESFKSFHPFLNDEVREEYTTLGEKAFLTKYRDAFYAKLKAHPATFFSKISNRFITAFFLYPKVFNALNSNKIGITQEQVIKASFYWLPFFLASFLYLSGLFYSIRIVQVSIIIYIIYLIPYILVAFYERYWPPLTPVFSIFCFYFIMHSFEILRRKRFSKKGKEYNRK